MAAVDIGLAKEEADPRQDDEVPYFDAIMQSLSEEDRARAEADPLDVLIIVRGYKGETPRKEGTLEAMRNICEWRKRVGYHDFFASKLPGHDEFHRYWPESIHGCDKYGHVLLCLRASEVDADSLEQMDVEGVEKLQGQKMRAYTEYKKRMSAETGVQRYKHSLLVDLQGASLSLTRSSKRALLKRIFDVGTHFYPETMWKIYLVNTPMLFRAVWAIVKPWLHPITAAKVNLLGGYPAALTHLEGDGYKKAACPDWMGGGSKGVVTKDYLVKIIEEHQSK